MEPVPGPTSMTPTPPGDVSTSLSAISRLIFGSLKKFCPRDCFGLKSTRKPPRHTGRSNHAVQVILVACGVYVLLLFLLLSLPASSNKVLRWHPWGLRTWRESYCRRCPREQSRAGAGIHSHRRYRRRACCRPRRRRWVNTQMNRQTGGHLTLLCGRYAMTGRRYHGIA